MLLDINYNRTQKQYEWTDPDSGEILTAPSGPENKAQLFRAAVGIFDPDLHAAALRMIEAQPQLERVVWKAVEIVANDGIEVFDVAQGNVLAMVNSSDGYGRYAVYSDNGHTACQCEHWQSLVAPLTQSGRRVCKHIAAMYLWKFTKEDRF
jgi:hypothetical protein